jgi:hypothetical protein
MFPCGAVYTDIFPPKKADADTESECASSTPEERWEPITELEIYRPIKAAKGTKDYRAQG